MFDNISTFEEAINKLGHKLYEVRFYTDAGYIGSKYFSINDYDTVMFASANRVCNSKYCDYCEVFEIEVEKIEQLSLF